MTSHSGKSFNSLAVAFFLSCYPIFHLFQNNIEIIGLNDVIIPILIVLSLFTLLIILFKIINKFFFKVYNQALSIPFILIWVFTYGFIYEIFDNSNGILFTIGRHRFLIGIYLLVSIVIFLFINNLFNLAFKKVLFTFLFTLNFIPIVLSLLFLLNHPKKYLKEQEQEQELSVKNFQSKDPDIFFIVLDMYPSQNVLLDFFDFNNKKFLDSCESLGFIQYPNSLSNYSNTLYSLTSTLNMRYYNFNEMSLAEIDLRMNDNEVVKYLKNREYKYYIFENGYFSKPKNKKDTYINAGEKNDIRSNRPSPDNDFLFFFLNKSIFSPILNKLNFTAVSVYRQRIYSVFNKFNSISKNEDKKFVFAHILSPHPPILFEENGGHIFYNDTKFNKEKFIGQIKFINNKTLSLLNELISIKSGRDKVIIIQGDHGSRSFLANSNISFKEPWVRERFGNLNMIYFSNLENKKIKEKYGYTSSVNTFISLFNNIFKDSLMLKPDLKYIYNDDKLKQLKPLSKNGKNLF